MTDKTDSNNSTDGEEPAYHNDSVRDGGGPAADDKTPTPDRQRSGFKIGQMVGEATLALGRGLGKFGAGMLSKMPRRTSVYRKMIRLGYQGLYKKTDAHLIVNTIYADDAVVPRPATVDSQTGNLETDNGEWWSTPNGIQKKFVGDVPVVTGHVDHHQPVDHIAARAAESLDYDFEGRQQDVTTANGQLKAISNQAVADGGQMPGGGIEDTHIDTSNPEPEADGMIISLEKMYDLHFDRGATEEMENQETRGRLAEMDPETDSRTALMYVLLLVAGLLLGLFGPGLAQSIGGGAPTDATDIAATLWVMLP